MAIIFHTKLGRGNDFRICIIITSSDDASTFDLSIKTCNLVILCAFDCLGIGAAILNYLKSFLMMKPSHSLRFGCIYLQSQIILLKLITPKIPRIVTLEGRLPPQSRLAVFDCFFLISALIFHVWK